MCVWDMNEQHRQSLEAGAFVAWQLGGAMGAKMPKRFAEFLTKSGLSGDKWHQTTSK